MCSSDPQSHSYISDQEREMLNTKIGVIHRTSLIKDAPWSEMIVNVPLLALICGQIGHDFGFFIMVTDLPKYLSDVLHFDIRLNGYYSALPFIVMFGVSILSGFIADFIIDHKWISMINCRKLFTALGAVLPAIGLIAASYAGCQRELVVILFTISMGTMGFFYSGMRVNGLDLSPRFAGTVMAFVNGIGAIMGVIAPIVVGIVTPKHTIEEYRIVFWVAFILLNGTLVVYVIWASGEVQPFNGHGHRSKPLPHVPEM